MGTFSHNQGVEVLLKGQGLTLERYSHNFLRSVNVSSYILG